MGILKVARLAGYGCGTVQRVKREMVGGVGGGGMKPCPSAVVVRLPADCVRSAREDHEMQGLAATAAQPEVTVRSAVSDPGSLDRGLRRLSI